MLLILIKQSKKSKNMKMLVNKCKAEIDHNEEENADFLNLVALFNPA